ncbi:MAG: response regulator [Geminicoccaceae bacterium]|nr:response regulator [Geminicoccaceae bacterium]
MSARDALWDLALPASLAAGAATAASLAFDGPGWCTQGAALATVAFSATALVHERALRRRLRARNDALDLELVAARDAAREAERAKSLFLASMSHEIRTPMTSVLGLTDFLAEEPLGGRAARYVRTLRQSSEQLLAIINDILDFMQIDSNGLALARTPFDLHALIDEVGTVMRPQAELKGLEFHIDAADGRSARPLVGDARRLKQVLFNLIGNAIKFTAEGVVTLRYRQAADADGRAAVTIEVEDTGIGIENHLAEELFAAFRQDETHQRLAPGGTGLGLTISRRLIDAMGGDLRCASVPGEGSLFQVTLGLETADHLTATADRDEATQERPLRILVAEDSYLNQELLTELLVRRGHRVVMTGDGEAALERAEDEEFDLMIFDIGMPVMDGETAMRTLRQRPGLNHETPAIVLTANVMENDKRRYLSAGFDGFATKPIDRITFFESIEKLTRRRLTDAPADPSPEPVAPPSQAVVEPLASPNDDVLDLAIIEQIVATTGEAWVRPRMQRALAAAEAFLTDAVTLTDEEELKRAAHKLVGSARNFGLAALADEAARIEHRGQFPAADAARMRQLVQNSRAALTARDLLPADADHQQRRSAEAASS